MQNSPTVLRYREFNSTYVGSFIVHLLSNKCITDEEGRRLRTQNEKWKVPELVEIGHERGSKHTCKLIQALQQRQSEDKLDQVGIDALENKGGLIPNRHQITI